jgi:AAA domain
LKQLLTDCSEELKQFQFSIDTHGVSCSIQDLEPCINAASALRKSLLEYRELDKTPPTVKETIAQKREYRDALRLIEDNAQNLFQTLTSHFSRKEAAANIQMGEDQGRDDQQVDMTPDPVSIDADCQMTEDLRYLFGASDEGSLDVQNDLELSDTTLPDSSPEQYGGFSEERADGAGCEAKACEPDRGPHQKEHSEHLSTRPNHREYAESAVIEVRPPRDANRVEITNLDMSDGITGPSDCEDIHPDACLALPSLRRVALDLNKDESIANWERLLWAFVGSDDIAAAFWLSKSLKPHGISYWPPAWIFAALYGATNLSVDDPMAYELLEFATHPDTSHADQLLRFSAALHAAVIAPESGMALWLNDVSHPTLQGLVTAVKRFTSHGFAFRIPKEPKRGATPEAELQDVIEGAKRWLEVDTPKRSFGMNGAWAVWQEFIGARGGIREMLVPVISDQRNEAQSVKKQIASWQDRGRADAKINQTYSAWTRGKQSRIIGGPRNHLLREIGVAVDFARRWCSLIQESKAMSDEDRMGATEANDLIKMVSEILPDIESEIRRLRVPDVTLEQAAAGHCLARSLLQLCATLGLKSTIMLPKQRDLFGNIDRAVPTLNALLNRRLLALPEVEVDDDQSVSLEALDHIPNALKLAAIENRSLEDLFHLWTQQRKDFQPARLILRQLEPASSHKLLLATYEDRLQRQRDLLNTAIKGATDEVERAVLDGILDDRDSRSEQLSKIESIDVGSILTFDPLISQIESIRKNIQISREARLQHLKERWEELQSGGMGQLLNSRPELANEINTISKFVQVAIDRADTRVLDECVASIAEILETGGDFKDKIDKLAWFSPVSGHDQLSEFMAVANALEVWIDANPENILSLPKSMIAGQNPLEPFGIQFSKIERQLEASKALDAWIRLKADESSDSIASEISTVLTYLGFEARRDAEMEVNIARRGGNWLLAHVSASPGNAARPISQFGSLADGKYPLVCFWGRPEPGPLISRLDQLNLSHEPVLIFYFGGRSDSDRVALSDLAKEGERQLAVLDENLLLFLLGQNEWRLRAFFRCALPFSATIPYTPRLRGRVPEEMFVGRDEVIREIRDPQGSCLIFGGRQLGKTAIARHVEALYNKPDEHRLVWWISMHEVFQPEDRKGVDSLWEALRKRFHIQTRDALNPDKIKERIVRHLQENPLLRVLIIFDEADDFLEADAETGFRESRRIRDLMDQTQRRLKVVFAGNYKVQRFSDVPDQPLAHFGAEIVVGPLAPAEARELVRRPLHAVGYHFDNDATVIRILSYTNYHAVLIHVFCHALLRRLHKRRGSAPPFTITRDDVEAVYKDPSVRREIREVFELTLALEPDYQAIIFAMIDDQLQMRDSYARPYPARDILLCLHERFPAYQAKEITSEQLRLRLEELCGLGVLVENVEGSFRLRSPNLVRMIGEEHVKSQIGSLRAKERTAQTDAESNHACLNAETEERRRFSPLTYAQERLLNKLRTGVALVFASEASGLRLLPKMFRHFVSKQTTIEIPAVAEISISDVAADGIGGAFRSALASRRQEQRLVLYCNVGKNADCEALINASVEFCKAEPTEKQIVRVVLVFDPGACLNWMLVPEGVRDRLESMVDATVCTTPWTPKGIAKRLEYQGMSSTAVVCELVSNATGGWQFLLDELFESCDTSDPTGPTEELVTRMSGADHGLMAEFIRATGLDASPVSRAIAGLIAQHSQLEPDFLTPEFLSPAFSIEQCAAAAGLLSRLGCIRNDGRQVQLDPVVKRVLYANLNDNLSISKR